MKKQVLMALLCASVTTVSEAQYSNATLNGPWFAYMAPLYPYGDSLIYVVFDGNGAIPDMGAWCDDTNSAYSVTTSGAISGSFDCDGGMPFSGQLYSQDSAMITVQGIATPFTLARIADPGALAGILTGGFTTQNCGSLGNVILDINNDGVIIGASGLTAPVTGRVFSDHGVFQGHIRTGDTNEWQEFSIMGYQTGATLAGIPLLEGSWGTNCGTTALFFTWTASTAIPDRARSAMALNVFPNPASSTIQLSFDEPIHGTTMVNIFDGIGKLVSTHKLQRDQQQIDISTLGNGSYLVQVIADDRTGTQRLVVQR